MFAFKNFRTKNLIAFFVFQNRLQRIKFVHDINVLINFLSHISTCTLTMTLYQFTTLCKPVISDPLQKSLLELFLYLFCTQLIVVNNKKNVTAVARSHAIVSPSPLQVVDQFLSARNVLHQTVALHDLAICLGLFQPLKSTLKNFSTNIQKKW